MAAAPLILWLTVASMGLAVAGCASDPGTSAPATAERGAPPAPSGPAAAAPCARLFVSPSGEPFRRADGGACPLDAWFAGADGNHDGALSRSEFQADAARFFATLDRNGDGVIGPDELQRYEQVIVPEILGRRREGRAAAAPRLLLAAYAMQFGGQGGGGGLGGGGGGGRGGGGRRHRSQGDAQTSAAGPGSSPDGVSRFGLLDEPEPVAGADLDFDGQVTRAEFLARASQRFDTLDTDGAGQLTLAALRARMAARGGPAAGPRSSEGGAGRHRRSATSTTGA